jgi:hypothetical protein
MAVAGIVLRIWTVSTSLGVMDADEAVVGLMARDWLDGEGTVFYWGQNYGGSQESLLVAVVYAVFPSAPMAAKVVPAALHAMAAVILWRIGQRIFGARVGIVAAGLFWLWPAAFVWWSIKARGHYGVTLVLSLLAVLLALRLAGDDLGARDRRLTAGGFGLVAGLGWWASFQAVFLVLPASIWLLFMRRRALATDATWAVAAAMAAALPWLAWNLAHGFDSFRRPPVVAAAPPYWGRLEAFFTDAFPRAAGATFPYTGDWAAGGLGLLALVVVLAAVALAGLATWTRGDRYLGLLVGVVVAYPFLFAASPFFYVDEPRYLYFLSPVLALLVARLAAARAVPTAVPAVVVSAAALLSVTTLATMANIGLGLFPAGGVAVPRHLDPVIDALDQRGIHHAFAPYGLAYRITLDSGGEVAATPIEHVRDPELNDAVRSADRPAWVFMTGSDLVLAFEGAARHRGVEPRCAPVEVFTICTPDARFVQEDLPELQP